MKFEIPITEMT